MGQCPLIAHLTGQLIGLHRPGHVLPNIKVPATGVLIPPFHQRDIIGRGMPDLPIDLGDIIIDPALLHPIEDISIEIIIILQAVRRAARAVGRAPLIAVDAKGADAETDPRLGQQDRPLQLADQGVDILAPPLVALARLIAHRQAIFPETPVVGESQSGHRVGIEIIIHVDRVDVVAAHDITHHQADELPAIRNARIKEDLLVVFHEPFGVLIIYMCRREPRVARRAGPVRIQPSVKLHSPLVTFVDQEGDQVKITLRRPSLLTRIKAAPRLDLGRIKRVRLRPHLEYDRVHPAISQEIKLAPKVFFQLGDRHGRVLALERGLYPGATELPFRGLPPFHLPQGGLTTGRARGDDNHHKDRYP